MNETSTPPQPPPRSTNKLAEQRQRFNTEVRFDESDLAGLGYASLLLYHREAVFDRIFQGQDLVSMIRYYLLRALAFAAITGAVLGTFSMNLQILAGALKAPALLAGSLVVCLPALFTFNVLLGSRLSFLQTLAVVAVSTFLLSTVLVSLAPILLFFIISTSSKPFVVLLCVGIFGVSGLFGVSLLWSAMGYLTVRSGREYDAKIVQAWTVIYAFVGTQLAWILRPFVGDPGNFAWFRDIEGNFYVGLYQILGDLFGR